MGGIELERGVDLAHHAEHGHPREVFLHAHAQRRQLQLAERRFHETGGVFAGGRAEEERVGDGHAVEPVAGVQHVDELLEAGIVLHADSEVPHGGDGGVVARQVVVGEVLRVLDGLDSRVLRKLRKRRRLAAGRPAEAGGLLGRRRVLRVAFRLIVGRVRGVPMHP